MMKKILLAIAVVVIVGAAAFAVNSVVQAQTPTTEPDGPGFGGFGMRGQRGGDWGPMMGRGGMAGRGGMMERGEGWMHDAMLSAFAEKLGISVDDLQARVDAGDSMWVIAQEKGLTEAEFTALHDQVRSQMLEQAVKDGTLTQEQADRMQTRGGGRMMNRGDCPMYGDTLDGESQGTPGNTAP